MTRLTLTTTCIAVLTTGWSVGPRESLPDANTLPKIKWSDNRHGAGTLSDGELDLKLEVVEGEWHLLGDDQHPGVVLAFAERGKDPTIPGPMIRVPLGTSIQVTVDNPLDTAVVIYGLDSREDGALDPLHIPPHSVRTTRFTADVEGTFFYWGAISDVSLGNRYFEDSQLSGALIVEGPSTKPDDAILMISMWYDGRLESGAPDFGREFLVINGRPWPYTERLTYSMGDSIRWRIINVSESIHAMHLHGFYFRVDARGDNARDTLYWPAERRMAVTERIATGTTMSMVWSPDRPGGWIFHCHMSAHVAPNASMTEHLSDEERFLPLFRDGHLHHDANNHVVEGMGGLMMGMYVQPPEGWVPNEPKRREMRLFIQSDSATGGLSGRHFAYVLQEGNDEPAPDSVLFPSSTLVLRKGEPTSIKVFNRTDEASQIHWHGLEIESYFDGVAGVGGYPERLTPAIAPGDSFEIRITPPRAGSFMYHTHVNDLRQQGSGLYGSFIVIDQHEEWNPDMDRIFLFGESPFRDDEVTVLNGANPPDPITFKVGTTYRLRMLDITLNRPNTRLRLLRDGFPEQWRPLAKDGFDLAPEQRRFKRADRTIAVGETIDYEYTPTRPGELILELRQGNGRMLVQQVINVVN